MHLIYSIVKVRNHAGHSPASGWLNDCGRLRAPRKLNSSRREVGPLPKSIWRLVLTAALRAKDGPTRRLDDLGLEAAPEEPATDLVKHLPIAHFRLPDARPFDEPDGCLQLLGGTEAGERSF